MNGILQRGCQIPPSRMLAAEIGVSRNTIQAATEQLISEGYLEARKGSGTFVTRALPEEFLTWGGNLGRRKPNAPRPAKLALRLSQPAISVRGSEIVPFASGIPALDPSLLRLWGRSIAQLCLQRNAHLMGFGDPQGHPRLRQEIARYLTSTRGVDCSPDEVIVGTASQQLFTLVLRNLLSCGDLVAAEDPGHLGFRAAALANGQRLTPVPVDENGLIVEELKSDVRLVFVSPSCQYPTGATLSLPRRLKLVAWARKNRAWILEYDYVSAFRYSSRPLLSLYGLDPHGSVLYMNTFSEVLFPAIRSCVLVAPRSLASSISRAHAVLNGFSPHIEQAALAEMLAGGYVSAYVRRMRKTYVERKTALLSALHAQMGKGFQVLEGDAMLDVILPLPNGPSDVLIVESAKALGLEVAPLSPLYMGDKKRTGLILGYAAFTPAELSVATATLRKVLENVARRQ